MTRKLLIFMALLILLSWGATSPARTVDEEAIDIKTRKIAKTLRCAVCQTESVWESNAGLARQMREVIRERVAQGQSAEEIRAYFLGRYGDYILLEPRKSGLNWVIWAGPFILLGVGGVALFLTLRRWTAKGASRDPQAVQRIDDRQRQRIEQEYRSLDQ